MIALRRPRTSAVAALLLLWVAGSSRPESRPEGAVGRAPRLLVLVAVDGLPWDLLRSHRGDLTGGLRTLLEEGRVETACRYRHLNTDTAPGHASLSTGAPPRVHGIVGNHWCEGAGPPLRSVAAVEPVASGEGRDARAEAIGPRRLLVSSLGDRIVEKWPDARVVSVGGKSRAAIFLAGKDSRHIVYWQERPAGRFETSAYYDAGAPGAREAARIVARFNDARVGSAVGVWASRIGGSVSRFFSGVFTGRGVRGAAAPLTVIYTNELVTDLALEMVRSRKIGLGRGRAPGLLAVGYSETDAVLHQYGTVSREATDALLRLDRSLGRLLDELRREFPPEGEVVLGLSTDHGFLPSPSKMPKAPEDIGGEIGRALARELCLDPSAPSLVRMHGWSLWYERGAEPLRAVEGPCGPAGREIGPRDLDRALQHGVVGAMGGFLEAVLPTSARDEWSGDPRAEFAENLMVPGRMADAYVFPRPGVLSHPAPGLGSSHGSHHDHDAHVPLLFWGEGVSAGLSNGPCSPYDLAPTLAARVGLVLPDATGRDLLAPPASASVPR